MRVFHEPVLTNFAKGRSIVGPIAPVGAGNDTLATVKSAYGDACRAIIRYGCNGPKLPLEKYDAWRNIEETFNPERMRL